MAVTMMLPMANAQELTKQQAKAVKKEVSKKLKELKKGGFGCRERGKQNADGMSRKHLKI